MEIGVCSISRRLKGHIFDRFRFYSVYSEGHFSWRAYPPYRCFYEGHISEKIRCRPVILKGIFLGELISVCPISRFYKGHIFETIQCYSAYSEGHFSWRANRFLIHMAVSIRGIPRKVSFFPCV